MIVYVETNFLLELALAQEHTQAASELLVLATQRAFTLVIPSFALSEAFSTLAQRERNRRSLQNNLSQHLRDLRRSAPHQSAAAALEPLLEFLQGLEREEFGRLQQAVGQILATAHIVEFNTDVYALALRTEERFGLSPQDAIVYASVLHHLRSRPSDKPKIFVSTNFKDFEDPDLVAELHAHGCRYEVSFEACLAQVRPT